MPFRNVPWSLPEGPNQSSGYLGTVPPTATFEVSIYIGIIMLSLLYGIYYILFIFTIYFLRGNSTVTTTQRRFYWVFSFTLVLLNTISIIGIIRNGQMMWITHRNDTGGPMAYYYSSGDLWWMVFSQSSQIAANFLAGLLLIYWCYMIFERNIWVVILPLLCAFAFPALFAASQVLFSHGTTKTRYLANMLGAAMLSITVFMNFMVTIMICGRLVMAYRHQKGMIDRPSSQLYPAIIAILLESSAPFCVLGTITCVLYAMDRQYESVVALLWYGACVIFGFSPQLIILRMAMSDHINGGNQVEQLSLSTLEFASSRRGRPDRTRDESAALETQNNLHVTGTSQFGVGTSNSNMQPEKTHASFDIGYQRELLVT